MGTGYPGCKSTISEANTAVNKTIPTSQLKYISTKLIFSTQPVKSLSIEYKDTGLSSTNTWRRGNECSGQFLLCILV